MMKLLNLLKSFLIIIIIIIFLLNNKIKTFVKDTKQQSQLHVRHHL